MKILHITPTFYSDLSIVGGGERYIEYLSESLVFKEPLAQQIVEQAVLSFSDSFEEITKKHLHYRIIPGSVNDLNSFDFDKVHEIINDYDLVFVHQCLTDFGLYFASIAKLSNKVVIGLDHGGGKSERCQETPFALSSYDQLWAHSDFIAVDFKDFDVPYSVLKGPIAVEKIIKLKKRSPNLIVSVGRILPHKGFETVLKAIAGLNFQYKIIGRKYDEAYFQYIVNVADELKVDVEIITDASDFKVSELMSTATVYVQPSVHSSYDGRYFSKPELLGLSSLEALSHGTPTLVSTAGSLPELGEVYGCKVFKNDSDLRDILLNRLEEIRSLDSNLIRDSVDSHYGYSKYNSEALEEFRKLGIIK